MLPLIPKKMRSLEIIDFKISGDQMMSTPIQLDYAVFILITP